ncbi:DUF4349 domain-containing protein [Nevskia soli]|uniref:DUF4349 domain-containing protein n=1 Tax=Nevskia soli TaxID=418856 RepID=UPI0015D7714A|nr:DUF4349 domain-containing protein [Nevskia soli]
MRPEELMAYLDGELLPARAGMAGEHLKQCGECRTLRAELESVSGQMREWEVEVPSFSAPYPRKPAKTVKTANRQAILVFAALVIMGVVGISFFGSRSYKLQSSKLQSRGIVLQDYRSFADPRLAVPVKIQKRAPMLVHGAGLTIVCKDFGRARAAMDNIVAEHHGYVAQMQVNAPAGESRSLTATVNTPAADLDHTVEELKALGRVQSEARTATEVTDEVVDVDARLANARNAEQRLNELLRQRTGSVSDVLAVENQIDDTRGTIEKLVAEKEALSDRLAFSAIVLQLNEEEHKPAANPSVVSKLGDAAVRGYENLVGASAAILAFLLAYGPALVLWSLILFFPARFVWRAIQVRR